MASDGSKFKKDGILKSISDSPPTHYTVKTELFSMVTQLFKQDGYESSQFESGGYKWKLVLYPNGNKSRKVGEHISLYLVIAETNSLPTGWEVYVDFRLFLLDQNKRVYSVFEDAFARQKCFNGAVLDAVDRKIQLYPKGCADGKGSHISLFLRLATPETLPSGSQILADFTLRILDQIHSSHHSLSGTNGRIFSALNSSWGYNKFMTLEMFSKAEKGFLKKDTCIVEAEVTVRGITGVL